MDFIANAKTKTKQILHRLQKQIDSKQIDIWNDS